MEDLLGVSRRFIRCGSSLGVLKVGSRPLSVVSSSHCMLYIVNTLMAICVFGGFFTFGVDVRLVPALQLDEEV